MAESGRQRTIVRGVALTLTVVALLPVTYVLLVSAGCANQAQLAPGDTHRWPDTLTEDETARMKQAAWDAANSPETVKRFPFKRSTTAPMKLRQEGIHVYLDQDTRDKADVAIPDESVVDYHAHYIGVTVDRGTYEVLAMYESFWP